MEKRNRRIAAVSLAATFAVGGATMIGGFSREYIAVAMFACAALALLWGYWPELRSRLEGRTWWTWRRDETTVDSQPSQRLTITPAVHELGHAFPADSFHAMLEDRDYLILTVRNTSGTTLRDIVARCSVTGQSTDPSCYWSSEVGRKYVPGEVYAVDLPVDHERVLLVAMVFDKERLWARLPSRLEYVFSTTQVTSYGDPKRLSYLGEPLDLGEELELVVTFKATGLDQTERIRLGFDASGPTVVRVTPPAGRPRPKSGS